MRTRRGRENMAVWHLSERSGEHDHIRQRLQGARVDLGRERAAGDGSINADQSKCVF